MNSPHLSEKEIQEYSLGEQINPSQARHILECAACSTAVANYKLLFSEISIIEAPVFNFDVERIVLAKLPARKTSKENAAADFIIIGTIALCAFIVPLFIMSRFLTRLFSGIPAITMAIIVLTALTIVILQCREMLLPYREKMRLLNSF